jgi:hypothetical protein
MNVRYTKDDYLAMANERRAAFRKIADKLGKDHVITKMMGSLAWGRHDAEQGPAPSLASAIREMAYLDGYFHCLKLYARDHEYNVLRLMNDIYPFGWKSVEKRRPAAQPPPQV